jgi:uncharacterized protein
VKFHLAKPTGNVVTGFGADWVRIGATEYRANIVLTPDTIIADWASGGFDGLTEADFAKLIEGRPDVVLLGTGAKLRFPPPRLTRSLVDAGIGLEVMDTAAACRTYNILAAEGRKVAVGLLVT